MNDIDQKALSNLEGFVKIITNLVRSNKISFDLLVGSGDTGIAMVKLTEMTLSEINVPIPTKLVIPYYRFVEKHVGEGEPFQSNSVLLPEIREQLKDVKNIQSILFVDDEIGKGRTVKGIVELLVQAKEELFQKRINLYIVAEDRSYAGQDLGNLVNVQYCPFGEGGLEGNAISHIIPPDIKEHIKKSYRNLYLKEELNALLNLPIKAKDNEKPKWSYDLLNGLKNKLENFDTTKVEEILNDIKNIHRLFTLIRGKVNSTRLGLPSTTNWS